MTASCDVNQIINLRDVVVVLLRREGQGAGASYSSLSGNTIRYFSREQKFRLVISSLIFDPGLIVDIFRPGRAGGQLFVSCG